MYVRIISIVEIVNSLRLLPIGCCETAQWAQLLPRFQIVYAGSVECGMLPGFSAFHYLKLRG